MKGNKDFFCRSVMIWALMQKTRRPCSRTHSGCASHPSRTQVDFTTGAWTDGSSTPPLISFPEAGRAGRLNGEWDVQITADLAAVHRCSL